MRNATYIIGKMDCSHALARGPSGVFLLRVEKYFDSGLDESDSMHDTICMGNEPRNHREP